MNKIEYLKDIEKSLRIASDYFTQEEIHAYINRDINKDSELIERLKAVGAKEEFSIEGLELGDDIRAFTFNKEK